MTFCDTNLPIRKEFSMSKAGKVAKITFKVVVLGISLFIYSFFIFRLCSTQDAPKSVSSIVWNETTRAAYQANPEEFQILSQEPSTFITDNGRFWISDVVYLPQAKQLQLTIKYNDSTLKYLKEALAKQQAEDAQTAETDSGEDVPLPEIVLPDEPFDYSILDNSGVRYHEYSSIADREQNYNYRRLVFENIEYYPVHLSTVLSHPFHYCLYCDLCRLLIRKAKHTCGNAAECHTFNSILPAHIQCIPVTVCQIFFQFRR